MANTRTRWTKEEDKILVRAIKANPHNKEKAFRKAATKLKNRDAKSKHYVGCMFTMIGIASRLDNRTLNRECAHVTPVKTKKSLWSKIKELLGL